MNRGQADMTCETDRRKLGKRPMHPSTIRKKGRRKWNSLFWFCIQLRQNELSGTWSSFYCCCEYIVIILDSLLLRVTQCASQGLEPVKPAESWWRLCSLCSFGSDFDCLYFDSARVGRFPSGTILLWFPSVSHFQKLKSKIIVLPVQLVRPHASALVPILHAIHPLHIPFLSIDSCLHTSSDWYGMQTILCFVREDHGCKCGIIITGSGLIWAATRSSFAI